MSESDANDYFIRVINDAYLTTIIHGFKNQRKGRRLKWKIPAARHKWLVKSDQRRWAEEIYFFLPKYQKIIQFYYIVLQPGKKTATIVHVP